MHEALMVRTGRAILVAGVLVGAAWSAMATESYATIGGGATSAAAACLSADSGCRRAGLSVEVGRWEAGASAVERGGWMLSAARVWSNGTFAQGAADATLEERLTAARMYQVRMSDALDLKWSAGASASRASMQSSTGAVHLVPYAGLVASWKASSAVKADFSMELLPEPTVEQPRRMGLQKSVTMFIDWRRLIQQD